MLYLGLMIYEMTESEHMMDSGQGNHHFDNT